MRRIENQRQCRRRRVAAPQHPRYFETERKSHIGRARPQSSGATVANRPAPGNHRSAADDAPHKPGQYGPVERAYDGTPSARNDLYGGAGPARYRALSRGQYRHRLRHQLYRRRARPACRGHRADPRQRDLRRDRPRPAVPRRHPAAPRQADPGLRQCRGLSRVRPALCRSPRAMSTRISTGCGRRRRSTARANRSSSSAPATLRPIVDAADYLLDLHSMQHATAPLMLAGLLGKSRELARRVGIPELIMCDAGHAAGPRMRDYGGFGDPASPKTALLIECGQHWERRAAEVATDVMLRFLIALGTVDPRRCRRARRPRFRRAPAPAGDRGDRGGDDLRRAASTSSTIIAGSR